MFGVADFDARVIMKMKTVLCIFLSIQIKLLPTVVCCLSPSTFLKIFIMHFPQFIVTPLNFILVVGMRQMAVFLLGSPNCHISFNVNPHFFLLIRNCSNKTTPSVWMNGCQIFSFPLKHKVMCFKMTMMNSFLFSYFRMK